MASDKNPTHSSILQALLDVEAAGFSSQLAPVIAQLKANSKLLNDLEVRYQQRGYNQDKVKFAQVTIDERLMLLGDSALRILLYLGMYCAQDGLVSVKANTLARATGVGTGKTAQRAVKELMDAGLLVEIDGARRHEPAIWQVHPGVIHTGKRKYIHSLETGFLSKLSIAHDRYLMGKTLDMVTLQDSVHRQLPDGSKLYYMRLDLVSPQEKEPSDAGTTSKGSSINHQSHDTSDQLPGQMDIMDFIENDDDLHDLPF